MKDVSGALSKLNLSIQNATITTSNQGVKDTFLVKIEEGAAVFSRRRLFRIFRLPSTEGAENPYRAGYHITDWTILKHVPLFTLLSVMNLHRADPPALRHILVCIVLTSIYWLAMYLNACRDVRRKRW